MSLVQPDCAYCEDPEVFETYDACPLCSRPAPDLDDAEERPAWALPDFDPAAESVETPEGT